MKICFVTEDGVNGYWDGIEKSEAELTVFGFGGMGLVDYKRELDGDTSQFEDIALMSKELKSVIISGCETDTYGQLRLSAAVADKGKILGVSDMVHVIDGAPYECGSGFRVYDTSCGKIGVRVSTDLFFPDAVKILALSECDFIVSVFGNICDSLPQVIMRASAYSSGVAVCMCANAYAQVAGVDGKILFSSPDKNPVYDLKPIKDYRLIESRRRGLYKQPECGF